MLLALLLMLMLLLCLDMELALALLANGARAAGESVQIMAAHAVPPRAAARRAGCASAALIASVMQVAASVKPRCPSIIAAVQICPTGLAMPLPAISGAEP